MSLQLNEYEIARFWSKVDKNGPVVRPELGPCWVWTAGKFWQGYGNFKLHDNCMYAHRVAYFLEHGEEPPLLMHDCDNPPCVRHLIPGIQSENMQMTFDRGRQGVTGEAHGMAFLTENDVREIRRLYKETSANYMSLAAQFNIHKSTVRRIVIRRLWDHVA